MIKQPAINQKQPLVNLNQLPGAKPASYGQLMDDFDDLSHQIALVTNTNKSLHSIAGRLRDLGDKMRYYFISDHYNYCTLDSIAEVASQIDRITAQIKDELDSLVWHVDKQHHLTRGVHDKARRATTEASELRQYFERLEALGNAVHGSVNAEDRADLQTSRHPRFEEIKQQVQSGRYQIDLERTATKMILDESAWMGR